MNLKDWAKAAAIRAIKTFAQTAVAMLPASMMITEVDWMVILGTAALAAVASILTSIAGLPEVKAQAENDMLIDILASGDDEFAEAVAQILDEQK